MTTMFAMIMITTTLIGAAPNFQVATERVTTIGQFADMKACEHTREVVAPSLLKNQTLVCTITEKLNTGK